MSSIQSPVGMVYMSKQRSLYSPPSGLQTTCLAVKTVIVFLDAVIRSFGDKIWDSRASY